MATPPNSALPNKRGHECRAFSKDDEGNTTRWEPVAATGQYLSQRVGQAIDPAGPPICALCR